MRVWDINPGYLNRESLLGEHRELHGIISILTKGKKGYSRHPETLRWQGLGWALRQRHEQLVCEMALRSYRHQSPARTHAREGVWPNIYVDMPGRQYEILAEKYKTKAPGRIPLPRNAQELWSHHKYSVLARSQKKYREIGRKVTDKDYPFPNMALELSEILRQQPSMGGVQNAVEHMWGYLPDEYRKEHRVSSQSLSRALLIIQRATMIENILYLKNSTALSELMVHIAD